MPRIHPSVLSVSRLQMLTLRMLRTYDAQLTLQLYCVRCYTTMTTSMYGRIPDHAYVSLGELQFTSNNTTIKHHGINSSIQIDACMTAAKQHTILVVYK